MGFFIIGTLTKSTINVWITINDMDNKEEMIGRVKAIKDVNKQVEEIYALLGELGIKYKRTGCFKCRRDYLNIIKEELGLIKSAAHKSSF